MGIMVDQGFDKQTVLNVNALVPGERDIKLLIVKYIPLMLEFVTPDIAFVNHRIARPDLAQKIAAGQTGMPEFKARRMVGRDAVNCIKLDHLVQGNQISDEGGDIVVEFPQIDIDPLHDPVQEFLKFFHWRSLFQIFKIR